MADWKKIKTEYITTDTSYRKLAQKHGVHYNAIANRAKQEGWISQRNQYRDKTMTNTLDAISNKQVDRAANLISVADKLLAKVKALLETDSEVISDTQAMKHISGVLKDIKEIQMIRSDDDMREQKARITNLERTAEESSKDKEPIRVIIADGLEDYSK